MYLAVNVNADRHKDYLVVKSCVLTHLRDFIDCAQSFSIALLLVIYEINKADTPVGSYFDERNYPLFEQFDQIRS